MLMIRIDAMCCLTHGEVSMNLRSALRIISHELGIKGRYTYDDVIAELRVRHPDLIAEESRKLEAIALKRMLRDVDGRQARTFNAAQAELFPELAGFPGSYDARTVGVAEEKGVRVLLQLLPISVVRGIASLTNPPKKLFTTGKAQSIFGRTGTAHRNRGGPILPRD